MTRILTLFVLFMLVGSTAGAQTSRSGEKSSNVYRRSYQRMALGGTSEASFEIRGGTLWGWGNNADGRLGDGTTTDKHIPTQIGTDNKWVSVTVGNHHTIGLKSDGSLWAWGNNVWNQLGDGTITNRYTPVRIGTDNKWVSASAGYGHTIGLKSDGTLWAWGWNYYGQLGHGGNTSRNTPTQIGTDNKWTSLGGGAYHTAALKSDGTLWAWGDNANGQLGDGTNTDRSAPVRIGTDANWVRVAGGTIHTLALKSDGTLWGWGSGTSSQLGNGTYSDKNVPTQIGTDTKWVNMAGGYAHSMGLKSDGTLWGWGSNTWGQLGNGTNTGKATPSQIGTDTKWVSIAVGYGHTAALKSDGSLWTWGQNNKGQLGDGSTTHRNTLAKVSESSREWLQVAKGPTHTLALKSDGTLWAWGDNSVGQLGDGTTTNKNIPTQIGTDTKWVSAVAGHYYTIALKSDGTLWGWGYNNYGQLGDGTTTSKNIPTQIGTDTKWMSMAVGYGHTIAVKSDGTLWAWGWNGFEQLGDGTNVNKNAPTQIGTDNQWVSVAAGYGHNIGLKSDGSLWAWGWNAYGQLGDGTTTNRNTPTQVGTATKWVSIGTGHFHNAASQSDGTLWTWGYNNYGQLGDGSLTNRNNPTQIGTDTKWLRVIAGGSHTTCIKSDGTLWAWGYNDFGQLGNGTTTNTNTPAQIASQTNVVAIGTGTVAHYSAILKSSRDVICLTGLNNYGQLVDGTTTISNSFSCTNLICRAYPSLTSAPSTSLVRSLGGPGNRTDFQSSCVLLASVMPSGTAPVSGNLTARTLLEPSVPTFAGHAYVARHYDLLPAANPNTATATITLYFTQSEFDDYNAANGTDPDLPSNPSDNAGIANLRVSQFHGAPTGGYLPGDYPTSWSGAGAARVLLTPSLVFWNEQDNRWEVTVEVTGFSGFFVHGDYSNAPLPVSIASFSASVVGDKDVLVNWLAVNTQEDKTYIIARSADGETFTDIGSVEPTAANDYRFHDYAPLMGKSYYRLRTMRVDGGEHYSPVRSVVLHISGNTSAVRVYPAPAKDYVVLESSNGGAISGVITDMQGRVLMQIAVQSGERVSVEALASGVYLLRLADGQTVKIIKE